jgi:glycosyltransferase involved in cell wall biosynthesis
VSSPILQVISADHRRGAEVYAVDLRDELRRRGRSMELVALRRTASAARLDVPALADTRFGGLPALRERARSSAGVIAHGSDALPATVLATLGTGVRFVYRSIGDPRYWSRRPDRRLRVGLQLRRATAVAATFAGAADALVEEYGLDRHRVHVVPNGRPLDRFGHPTAPERLAARRDLLGDREAPVVLFLGALTHEKAPERAVQTIAQLPDLQLLVVGDGPLRATIDQYGAAIAPGRVHVVGARDDTRTALLAADVVLVPSRTEGFPGTAIEAGLCAVPVVGTDVGAMRDVVVHGETGFVVEPTLDGLTEGVRHALAERDQLGAAARARCVERFDMRTVAATWDELLRQSFG